MLLTMIYFFQNFNTRWASTETALQWFISYLAERTQSVCINQTLSKANPLICGVRQDSVLGPIFFAAYTGQLGKIIESHGLSRKLYACDTQLYNTRAFILIAMLVLLLLMK